MTSPRKRRRKRRAPSLEAKVERVGHVALTSAWSAIVRSLGAGLRWSGRTSVRAWRWSAGLTRGARFALVAALIGAVVAVVLFARSRDVYVDDDNEALARVIHSECGVCSTQQQLHIAWATRNLAAERNESIADMVCSPCGKQQRGRPVSSRLAATDHDRSLARYVIDAPQLADPTGGATHFINPRLQDSLAAAGERPGYRGRPYKVVRKRWLNVYGWEPYYRLGPDLELWGPKRQRKSKRNRRR